MIARAVPKGTEPRGMGFVEASEELLQTLLKAKKSREASQKLSCCKRPGALRVRSWPISLQPEYRRIIYCGCAVSFCLAGTATATATLRGETWQRLFACQKSVSGMKEAHRDVPAETRMTAATSRHEGIRLGLTGIEI